MSDDILSHDEVEALLKGVDNGAVELATDGGSDDARLYNIGTHIRTVRGRMPTLEMINDRLVRQLRLGIHTLLGRTPVITVAAMQVRKFSEYSQSLPMPTSFNLVQFHPLRGTALVVFDSRLVFAMVDNFFGGFGRQSAIEGRDFTPTELRVIQRLLQQVLIDLKAAWAPVLPLQPEYQSSEVNPMFVNIAAPSEIVAIMSFSIELDGGGGDMHLTMPYSMLEPIRGLLDSDFQATGTESDGHWGQALRAQMEDVEINLVPVLGRSTLTVERLLSLKAGDMIPCDFEGEVTVFAEGVAAARGKYCSSRGKQAVQVKELLLGARGR